MMFLDSLVDEVRVLARRFTELESLRKADADGNPVPWNSPRGMLDLILACDRIADISTSIAKTGYRECDPALLADICAESRHILYNVDRLNLAVCSHST